MVSNKSAGVAILVVGIVLGIAGMAAYTYEEVVLDLYIYEVVDRPYQDIGMVLVILGIIMFVVGVIFAALPTKNPAPPLQQAAYTNAPPGSTAFCSFCGHTVAPGAAFCPGCGRRPG